MRKRLFLHVGMHKTGTSSIQETLFTFDDGNVMYAPAEQANHSVDFYTAFSDAYRTYHMWKRFGYSDQHIDGLRNKYRAAIDNMLARNMDRDLIISAEDICNIDPAGIEEVKALCDKYAEETTVIAYIRDPIDFMRSYLQEDIKNGCYTGSPHVPNYRKRLEKFITVFGKNNVVFRHYRRDVLVGQDAVKDFCDVVGIRFKGTIIHTNSGLPMESVRCMHALNDVIHPLDGDVLANAARDSLRAHCDAIFTESFTIDDDMLMPFVDWDDVAWVEKNTGIYFNRTKSKSTIDKKKAAKAIDAYLLDASEQAIDILVAELKKFHVKVDFDRSFPKIVHKLFLLFYHLQSIAGFSAPGYLALNADVKAAGVNPYEHYMTKGFMQLRRCK